MRLLLTACVWLVLTAAASAQVIVNPTKVEFPPSADHAVTFGGVDVVTKYELSIARQSLPNAPISTTDLGKPTPVAGVITVPLPSGLPTNTTLLATVRTIGPGGTTPSVVSDPFGNVAAPAAAGKPIPKP